MKVKEIMPLIPATYVRLFDNVTALTRGSVWRGYPADDTSWDEYKNFKVLQIDAINDDSHDGEIYIVMK